MKLRILGNSLRIRVSRSELAGLLHGNRVEDAIQFSTSPDSRLAYGLETASQEETVQVQWSPQRVTVLLSEERLKLWSNEAEVGVYESVDLGASGSLAVTIEKDFACLDRDGKDRGSKENADCFENPRAAC